MWKKTGNRLPASVSMERHARKTKTPELYKHHSRRTAAKATHGDGSKQPRPKPASLFRVLLDKEYDMHGWINSLRQMCHKYWCKTAAEQVTAVNQQVYKWIEPTRQNDNCHQKPLAVFISNNKFPNSGDNSSFQKVLFTLQAKDLIHHVTWTVNVCCCSIHVTVD